MTLATDPAPRARAAFRERHGRAPAVVGRAPGRVNLIGEHTDYNRGLCLPMAIPPATCAAIAGRADDALTFTSADGPAWHGTRAELAHARPPGWAAYVGGVVRALDELGWDLPGLDLHVESDVPLGAGLSSSAALTCAVAMGLAALVGRQEAADLRGMLVDATVRAETVHAGAPTGGLDQTVVMGARAGHALLIDFDAGSTRAVPWRPEADGLTVLAVDTRVSHSHLHGGYARRRAECESAATALGLPSLRAASLDALEGLPEPLRRRARHVVTENLHVEETVAAVGEGDWGRVGALWLASHTSLRDDFEVSCPELDVVVESAVGAGALGARMTGGGFGGTTIVLAPVEAVPRIRRIVLAAARSEGHPEPSFLEVHAAAGADVVPE